MKRLRKTSFLYRCAAVVALLAMMSCAGRGFEGFSTQYDEQYVWPAAPEVARVAYVASITQHEDLYKIGGGLKAIIGVFAGPPDSRLSRPYAIALHPKGIVITDPGRQMVHFYNWEDRKYAALGAESDAGLPSPVGIGVLSGGDIIVADSKLGTIERFGEDGKRKARFAAAGVVGRPAGIAVDAAGQRVFVADVLAHQVVEFDAGGNVMRKVGERGAAPGQFNFPTHVALDEEGNLLVTDSMNFRVQKLTPQGEPLATYGELGASPGTFSKPKGTAAFDGGVVVVEGLYDALQFFDSEGNLLMSVGASGGEPGQFWLPAGVAIDRAQNLIYVADSYNGRVQVFRILGGGVE